MSLIIVLRNISKLAPISDYEYTVMQSIIKTLPAELDGDGSRGPDIVKSLGLKKAFALLKNRTHCWRRKLRTCSYS